MILSTPLHRTGLRLIAAAIALVGVLGFASAAYAAGSWSLRDASTPNSLNGVSFIDNNNGLAVGANGTIRKTINGGGTWTAQTVTPALGTGDHLEAVTLVDDANHAWAVGLNGKIITTSDGGLNPWTTQTSGTGNYLVGVGFYGTNNGWAVGQNGEIDHYNGTTWTPSTRGSNTLVSISVVDSSHVWVVGDGGTIFHWNGSSWGTQDSGTWRALDCVAFKDANNGWAVGEHGVVLRTVDGGANWTFVTSGTTSDLFSVALTDATHGTAVGDGGKIFRIADGALSLSPVTSPTTNALFHVVFTDASHGWAVGEENNSVATVIAYTVPVKTSTTLSAPSSVKKGKTLKLTGHVSPAAAPGKIKIFKTRLVGKKWKSAGTATMTVVGGSYSYSFKPAQKGKWRFVATYSGGAVGYTNYAASASGTKSVTVK